MGQAKSLKEPGYRLRQGLTWHLSDPGMGLLERCGLAALYMTLRAAEELGKKADLEPLTWENRDLTPDSVTLRSTGDDRQALTNLFEWAWQVRDGVLYLPAVHRTAASREYFHFRLSSHTGIFCTFLQHPNTQPRMDWDKRIIQVDENEQYAVSFQSPAERVDDEERGINPKTKRPHKKKIPSSRLRLLDDVNKLVDNKGVLQKKSISLSNWVYPGIAGRYVTESSWQGSAQLTTLIMLAPITCLYSQMHKEHSTWLVVIPDVHDLEEFDRGRSAASTLGDPKWKDVASISDAGLRFLSVYHTHIARKEIDTGCRVVAMGKVGHYQSQSVRKGVVDVPANARILRRYRLLEQHLGNHWVRRRDQEEAAVEEDTSAKPTDGQGATGFYSVPTVRGRIADNLIQSRPWYADLTKPLQWDLDALEWQRKRRPGSSIERLWFNNLFFQRRPLMELINEGDMWDEPAERDFVHAFWEILGALYYRERQAVERGGSRTWRDRIEDLNEDIRRSISRAKTGPLLRQTIAELFARPVETYRSPRVRENPGLMWKFIDKDWKRGRDLALLALASYQSKEKRDAAESGLEELDSSNS